jgi:4-methyl-5(b-hydroxyethyl)-thiazole monophosphate biosynthesis
MTQKALVCLAHGSEEMEAVTAIDLLFRAGLQVTTASVAEDGATTLRCSRGVRLVADTTLAAVADEDFDVIVLPGGVEGAKAFRDSSLLVEKVRQLQLEGKLVAAICASPAMVLEHHNLYPVAIMTGYPTTKDQIAERKWVDKRVCYDDRVNLITSQGPATAIDFALKIIERLQGKEKAAEIAAQLVLPPGIYNYQDER